MDPTTSKCGIRGPSKRPSDDAACTSTSRSKKKRQKKQAKEVSATAVPTTDKENSAATNTTTLRVCAQCQESKLPFEFSARQRRTKGTAAKCRQCCGITTTTTTTTTEQSKRTASSLLQKCHGCHSLKHRIKSFSAEELERKGQQAKCTSCVENDREQQTLQDTVKRCSDCREEKKLSEFTKSERFKEEDAKCIECWHDSQIPVKHCYGCSEYVPLVDFPRQSRIDRYGRCYDCTHIVKERAKRQAKAREEEERHRTQPRKCSKCRISKGPTRYGHNMWWCVPPKQIICLKCVPEQTEESYWRDRLWKQSKNEFLAMAKKGTVFYELPDWEEELESKLIEKHSSASTPVEGVYDILYRYGYNREDPFEPPRMEQRTTRGTITFTRASDDDDDHDHDNENSSKLFGRVEFDKSMPSSISVCFDADYTITEDTLRRESSSREPTFSVQLLDEEVIRIMSDFGETISATIRVVKDRMACPWIPTEETIGSGYLSAFDDDKLVKFDSLEEAEALQEQFNQNRVVGKDSWLCNHFRLPPDTAKHILEYAGARLRPCPVLFFEPGDVLLSTDWYCPVHPERNGIIYSHLVARKRTEKENSVNSL